MSNDGFKRHYALGDSIPYLVTCATCGAEVAKQRPMVGEQGPELVDEIRRAPGRAGGDQARSEAAGSESGVTSGAVNWAPALNLPQDPESVDPRHLVYVVRSEEQSEDEAEAVDKYPVRIEILPGGLFRILPEEVA